MDESDGILFRLLNYFLQLYLLLFLYRCSYADIPYAGKLIGIAASFHSLLFSEYSTSIRFDIYIYTCLKFCLSGVKFPLFLCDLSRDYLRFVTVQRIYRARYFITRMADRLIISFTGILCVYFKTGRISSNSYVNTR